jgi:hypothetical protein
MRNLPKLTPMEATKDGYVSLTTPYSYKNPVHMTWFSTVVQDMAGCDCVLVEFSNPYSVEVWRHGRELNTIKG